MPNVMAALPNIVALSVQRRKVWLTPCSIMQGAKHVEICRVAQTGKPISAANGPKFTTLSRRVDEVLMFNKFFPIVYTCLHSENVSPQSCAMVRRWRFFGNFLRPVLSASRVHHVSDLHPKFALRPHHVWNCGGHPICDG